MNSETVPADISAVDWAATPPSVRALVVTLLQTIAQLQLRMAELEERLNQNSGNSSTPPSADPPTMPPHPKRTPSGRQPGGQPGHAGRTRPLKPASQVQRIVEVRPLTCTQCGTLLLGDDRQPQRHQVTELPRVTAEVTEYRRHTLTCCGCGVPTTADWPSDMPVSAFGPHLHATTAYLTGRMGLSQREVSETLATLFHIEVSLGSIPALEVTVSAALAAPVTATQTYVQQQPALNMDETGWYEQSKRTWLWVATTPLVSVFLLWTTRGAQGVHELLGELYQGIVGSDRWSAYNWLDPLQRQLCWAHLKRDFQKLVERGGESTPLGQALLAQVESLFHLWQRVREGTLARTEFQEATQPLRERVHTLLNEGVHCAHPQTQHFCANLLKLEAALWTFVFVAGVEPTNNRAERCLRRAVLWRRRSFGTQSEAGSQFVARILTTVTTLRQQKRDVLDYLTEACIAALRGETAPSLLPPSKTT